MNDTFTTDELNYLEKQYGMLPNVRNNAVECYDEATEESYFVNKNSNGSFTFKGKKINTFDELKAILKKSIN